MISRRIVVVLFVLVLGVAIALFAAYRYLAGIDWISGEGLNSDFVVQLAGRYELWRTSSVDIVITLSEVPNDPDSHQTGVVPAEVVLVGIQGGFITACQYAPPREMGHIPADDDYRYWIIRVREEQATGPLTENEFEASCRRLGIDSSSKSMERVDSYREPAVEATCRGAPNP